MSHPYSIRSREEKVEIVKKFSGSIFQLDSTHSKVKWKAVSSFGIELTA